MATFFQRLTRRKIVSFENSPLSRSLTLIDLTTLGIGSTVGVGFYILAGEVARNTAGPAVCISFLIAAIASLFSGLCYAEFGSRVPKAGSSYVYSYVCIGEFTAFVIGWNLILEYMIGTASVARGFSGYINELSNNSIFTAFETAMPIDVPKLSPYPDFFAFSMTIILAIILSIGVKESSRANNIFTGINIFVILYCIIAGATKADIDNWKLSEEEVFPNTSSSVCTAEKTSDYVGSEPWGTGGFAPYGFQGIMEGAATCFYGFVGFDIIATTGEEALSPERNIPLAIIVSLTFIFIAYFGMSAVITLALPYCMQDPHAPLIVLFDTLGMSVSKWIVSIGAIFGFSASLMGAMFPLPRIIYSMADDGLLFRFLSKVSKRFKTPLVATVIAGFIAASMALLFSLEDLVDMMSIGTLMAYTIVSLCVLLLRYTEREKNVSSPEYTTLLYTPESETESYFTNNEKAKQVSIVPPTKIRYSKKDYMKQLFNSSGSQEPTELSSSIATYATLIYATSCLLFAIFLSLWGERMMGGDIAAICCFSILGLMNFLLVVIISRQPQSKKKLAFKSPLVPWLPALSTFINWYLMCNLPPATWVRFTVWMTLGLSIYFFYGMKNSSMEYRMNNLSPPSHYNRVVDFTRLSSLFGSSDSEEECVFAKSSPL